MRAYVGAITGEPAAGEQGVGLTVLRVDEGSGEMAVQQEVGGLASPTYLALHPSRPVLYAGERHWPPMGERSPGNGSITTFGIGEDGGLTQLGAQPSGGPAHLTVHPDGRWVIAAMNRTLQVGVFPVQADGRVGEPTALVTHEGRGPKVPNQARAFPHSTWLDQNARRLLCCDLGMDRVMVYDFDDGSGRLAPGRQPFAQVGSGAGPRHAAFHPDGRRVYVLNELDSTICAFSYDAESGALIIQQTVSALPEDFNGQSAAAQIQVHPSGRWLYASNRGHDSIAIFAIDAVRGTIRLKRHQPSGGERPHNFRLNDGGTLMLVANQRSDNVVSFHVDGANGELEPTGYSVNVSSPVCVVMRPDI